MTRHPRAVHGNAFVDPFKEEMMRSLFDGRAIPGRRQRLAIIQRAEEANERAKITLPRVFEPAYLR